MINLPNRCQRLISRAEWHTVRLKGASGESEGLRRYDNENLLWQSGLTLLAPGACREAAGSVWTKKERRQG